MTQTATREARPYDPGMVAPMCRLEIEGEDTTAMFVCGRCRTWALLIPVDHLHVQQAYAVFQVHLVAMRLLDMIRTQVSAGGQGG